MTTDSSDALYRLLVQGVVDYAIYMLTPDGFVANWNAGAERAKGYRAEEIVGRHFSVFYSPQDRAEGVPHRGLEIARRDGRFEAQGWRLRKDGQAFWCNVVIDAIRDNAGHLIGFAKVTRDISDKRAAEQQRLHAQEMAQRYSEEMAALSVFLESVIANIPSSVLVQEAESGKVLLLNSQAERLYGITRQQLVGRSIREALPAALGDYLEQQNHEATRAHWPHLSEASVPTALGARTLRTSTRVICGSEPGRRYLLSIADDVTDEHAANAQIHHMAHHDTLTGLPNRLLFRQRLDQALAQQPRQTCTATLCLDLDNFKPVNDALGHAVGDALLRALAGRLRNELREQDTLARLGGDEFAVVMPALRSIDIAVLTAQRLIDAVRPPFVIDGHSLKVGLSVGIALAPVDHDSGEQLLRCADMALYEAKRNGRNRYECFRLDMDAAARQRRDLEAELRQALAARQLQLYYQPITAIGHGAVIGYEALLRWHHPERGLIAPDQFIAIAEESDLIHLLGAFALQQACQEAMRWPEGQSVAVNLSAVQFAHHGLVEGVAKALHESGLAARRLELEITEAVLLDSRSGNIDTLHQLKALGVRIALDDFGTGYSALSYLRAFPFDRIKIDKSFVQDMLQSPASLATVRAISGMSRGLEIEFSAEGVETAAQYAQLEEEGCSHFQGYLIGPPQPAAQRLLSFEP